MAAADHPYLTLRRLNELAAEMELSDDAVISGNNATSITVTAVGYAAPQLVVAWDSGIPRFWSRRELTDF